MDADKRDLDYYNHRIESSWWKKYPYKSLGEILHWLYVYCNLNIAEKAIVSKSTIMYCNVLFADFKYDEEKKMPIFQFVDASWNEAQRKYFNLIK